MPQKTGCVHTKAGVVEYTLSRSSRRRTIEIAVPEHRLVRVAAPAFALMQDIKAFIDSKADWIANRLAEEKKKHEALQRSLSGEGTSFLFLGEPYPLTVRAVKLKRGGIAFDGSRWVVSVPEELDNSARQVLIKEKLRQWYRRQAEEVLGSRIFCLARLMGCQPAGIAVRTQKRVWGSCDPRRRIIHLNWQLILAPRPVIDYVLVHELSHLDVPNHSQKFWQRVAQVLPDYKIYKQWLRVHAGRLIVP